MRRAPWIPRLDRARRRTGSGSHERLTGTLGQETAVAVAAFFVTPPWVNTKGKCVDSVFDPDVSAQLLLFAEQTADFVGVSDPWGRVLYLNPAARKRLGVADLTDLTVADFFPAEAITLYYEVIRPQLLRTGAWSGEVPVNVAGGVAVPMYISTSARLGPGGETNGSVVYAHELSRPDPARRDRGGRRRRRHRPARAERLRGSRTSRGFGGAIATARHVRSCSSRSPAWPT